MSGMQVFGMGILPIYALIAIILTIWLFLLFFRTYPLSVYIAYTAATLYPLLLGILGSVVVLNHFARDLGDNGVADPNFSRPLLIATDIARFIYCLGCGSLLTCIFFPLAILTLLIRRPK
jgi:hypothetical protein